MFLMVYSMADLMVFFIWTSVILTPAFCLTREQEELAAKVQLTTPEKTTRRTELTWINSDKITTPTIVKKTHNLPVMDNEDNENFCCGFSNCGTKFIDSLIYQNTSKKEFIFNNIEDTVVKNFSCRVYNVLFMNCTWTISGTAPKDVQYYLFSQNSRRQEEKECTSYIEDSRKRHVGCHFDELSTFRGKAHFLITGTSERTKIKNFCSKKISLFSIEIFNPPSNITVNCSETNCLIQWKKPKSRLNTTNDEFSYELDIRKQHSQYPIHDQPLILKGQNEYDFQNYDKATKYILKIKTSRRSLIWGNWSEPIEFGILLCKDYSPGFLRLKIK
ncbi:granulocyte-macrophage colony-stimulating factor receptor subunit alpha-like isoform X2 [Macrotis lagotis]|uniref:granulocyte-macrophage colony-stimulating factor receptor subunit alpha-like isoform X2 n=1 Tax=Macrotis lagotis TaxID=92651 RepID=UPI003D686819